MNVDPECSLENACGHQYRETAEPLSARKATEAAVVGGKKGWYHEGYPFVPLEG